MLRRSLAAFSLVVAIAVGAQAQVAAAATPKKAAPTPTKGVVIVNTDLALQDASAAGTGIVLTKDGQVLTNNHVIAGATTIRVVVPATHKTYVADVLGYDIADDVALLKLENATNLATATLGNSANVKVGQAATAVGNANGIGRLTVTKGKVLGVNRTISVQQDDGTVARLGHLVSTSARLVPGNSGGPLLNALGRVIGMNAAGSTSSTAGATGFAIAINHARTIAKQIAAQVASPLVHIGETAFIGVSAQDTPSGVAIANVIPGSAAETAGLAAGDVIDTIDGVAIESSADLRKILFAHHPGDQIAVGYTDRVGNAFTVTVTLGSGPPQ
jgi:S1-C subfamily serine protease